MVAGKWIELDADAPGALAVPEILGARLADFAKAVRKLHRRISLLKHPDEDATKTVHELRVSSRRAGIALVVLRECVPRQARKEFGRITKDVRRVAGRLRDCDVHLQLIESLRARDAESRIAGVAEVVDSIVHAREVAAAALEETLADIRPEKLRSRASRIGRSIGAKRGDVVPTLAELAATQLPPLVARVRELAAQDLLSMPNLHALRLALKRLRYAAEVFSPCLGGSFKDVTYPKLEEAQRKLGEVNDVSTLVDRLSAMVDDPACEPSSRAGLTALRDRYAAVRDRRSERIVQWWHAFDHLKLFEEIDAACITKTGGATARGAVEEELTMVANGQEGGARNGVAQSANDRNESTAVIAQPQSQRSLWLSGKRLAVIDVGSNSIRLLAVELIDERPWKVLAEERAMTRLAQGLGSTGLLSSEAMARSVEAIGRFKTIAEKLDAQVSAFATAAVREARNRSDFMSLVQDRTGLLLEIVSELDEGKLTHRSVARVYDLTHGSAAVVDIGGGSLEMVSSRDGVITGNTSMPLGAVRVTEAFGGADASAGRRFKELRRHVESEIKRHIRKPETPPTIIVGCGGTFTTMLTLAAASRGVMIERNSSALTTLGPVGRSQLKGLLGELRAMNLEQRLRVPGLPSDRADIVIAGFTVIERLMKRMGAVQVHVHPGGVREGLVLRMIDEEVAERTRAGGPAASEAELVGAAREFAARCRYERAHSERVAALALSLFDQFKDESELIPGLGIARGERTMLEAAAVLHDIGMMVEYDGHHRHSATIIRHADLAGWSPRWTAIVAAVARYHRRAEPKVSHEDFAQLSEPDRSLVKRLAAILRVADGLDRSHTQGISSVRVRFGNKRVHLEVRSESDPAADIKAAAEKSGMLADLLGVELEIVASGPDPLETRGASSVL